MFCKHEWKILSEKTTKSRLELLVEVVGESTKETKVQYQYSDLSRKYIQIVICAKCGELKRFVERI